MRRLPIIKFGGKRWYLDTRLDEFRNVENPHDRISIEDAFNLY